MRYQLQGIVENIMSKEYSLDWSQSEIFLVSAMHCGSLLI